jgi:hypothetical protein
MSRKRFLNRADTAVLESVVANLLEVGRLIQNYKSPTRPVLRNMRGLLIEQVDRLMDIVNGNCRHGMRRAAIRERDRRVGRGLPSTEFTKSK